MIKALAPLLLILLLGGCKHHDETGGSQYIADLSDMIQRADRIVVTEHSAPVDAEDSDTEKLLTKDEIVYGTRTLDQQQKKFFQSAIDSLDPKAQDEFSSCEAELHHTVKFYAQNKLISKMDICFKCDQVEWDGTKATPPWSLYSGLASFIKHVGLNPERDWTALAKQSLKLRNHGLSK